jgi:hypothetical protein
MAGDWLKMELTTPEKDETAAITAAMGWTDPDLTVGKLFRVWRWFDQHTTDGTSRLTVGLLDRQVACPGFAEAMASVGWLVITEHGITLPNFDRHNGETAKARALTARRVSRFKTKHESNGEGNAAAVTSALPREEKRREEVEPKTKRAHAIVLPFLPSESVKRWAADKFPAIDFDEEVSAFVDYHASKGSTFKDWDSAVRTWLRNSAKWSRNGTGNRPSSPTNRRSETRTGERGAVAQTGADHDDGLNVREYKPRSGT